MELHLQVKSRWPALADRFVFMTGDVMDAEVRAYLQGCGAPYLPKPFGLDELEAELNRLPEGSGQAAEAVLDLPPE